MMLRVCGGIPLLCKDSRITDMPEGLVFLPVDELLSCCMAVGAADCFWGEEEVLSPIISLLWETLAGWASLGSIIFLRPCPLESSALPCPKH